MDYEIAVFENSDLYDGAAIVPADKVVQTFIEQYKRYLNPEYYAEDDIWLIPAVFGFPTGTKRAGISP